MTTQSAKAPSIQPIICSFCGGKAKGCPAAKPESAVTQIAPSGLPVKMTGYETARVNVRANGAFVTVDVYSDAYDCEGSSRHFGGFDSTLEQARKDADAFAAVAMTWFSKNAVHPGHWPTAWRHEVFGAVAGSEVAS